MIEQVIHYQFGFYASNTNLEPEPDIIARLLEAFKDKGFIPTTIQEFQISPTPRMRLQLQFATSNGEWNLAFEPYRVLLKKENVSRTDIGSPENFADEAEEIFQRLLGLKPFNGTRLTYIMKGLLPEMPADKLVEVNGRVLNLLPFYVQHSPYQWTTRNVSEWEVMLGEKAEHLNVITDINRVQMKLLRDIESVSFDRIQIGFDINTYQSNTALRFCADDVRLFLNVAIQKSQDIMTEIESKLNG